ncbi:MAG: Crp/Fnr family transcriptional regulator [Pacificimonas sp.]
MDSCFIAKLQHYLPLTDREKAALTVLEDDPKDYPPGTTIFTEGQTRTDALYLVQHGRLHASTLLADGSRALLKLYYPGDTVGNSSLPFAAAVHTVVTVTESRLCRVPVENMSVIFEQHPRIAALLYSISMLEQVALSDRLRSIGRTDGKSRIGALFLEILSRMRITDKSLTNVFDVRLTKAEIGDATGLTHVHVNRLLRELTENGLITRKGSMVTILDEARLREESHFTDRYSRLASDWLPAAR